MPAFSPIAATYGARVEQFLESPQDYTRYHSKLNKKLQSLRHRCRLVTRDTKRYSSKEKYSKLTSDDYDKRNKLYGILVLLHIERDLSLVETLKLRAHQRGKLKQSERKVIGTRLKRAYKVAQNLVALTKNEGQWISRVQYLMYASLVHAEYLLHGKSAKRKNSVEISRELAFAIGTARFLNEMKLLSDPVLDYIRSKYEYSLMQHAGDIVSQTELQSYIAQLLNSARDRGEELATLLFNNGLSRVLQKSIMVQQSPDKVQWRAFNCKIRDPQIAQLIQSARSIRVHNVADYDAMSLKWDEALSKQEVRVHQNLGEEEYGNGNSNANNSNDDYDDEIGGEENEQILLAYIKYHSIFTSILRGNYLFNQLWSQWVKLGSSMSARLAKYKEMERIVNGMERRLQDITEVPGVYSDDELLANIELVATYFKLHLSCGCLASMYQSKGKYREALALYVDAYQKLIAKLEEIKDTDHLLLPREMINKKKLDQLRRLIENGWKSVIALAEYEDDLHKEGMVSKFKPTLVEVLNSGFVSPSDVSLERLFPLRPVIKPIPAKPTLFDLSFNYIDYTPSNKENWAFVPTKDNAMAPSQEQREPEEKEVEKEDTETVTTKRRGFLGFFSR